MDVSTFGPPVLNAINTSIKSSISELIQTTLTDSTITALIADYTALQSRIATDLSGISNFTVSSFPIEINAINTQLSALDTRKVEYLKPITSPKKVTFNSLISDTWFEIKGNIVLLTTVVGMMFGCIVASHWLITVDMPIDKNVLLYHIFYAIFGALLFPIPILYGLVNPPMWRAALIPLFKIKGGDPEWMSYPGINLFTYVQPTADDLPVGKGIIRVMCGIVTALIGISIYLKLR
jgi:hypothetical protein